MKPTGSLLTLTFFSLLCDCYIWMPRFFDESQSLNHLNMIFLGGDYKFLSIPGHVNMIVYDSENFMITSRRHFFPVVIHPFDGIVTIDTIPGTLEIYVSTNSSKIYRLHYLTGTVINETLIQGIAIKIQAFPDGSFGFMTKTGVYYMSAEYTILLEFNFTAETLRDFIIYPYEAMLYVLLRDRIILHSMIYLQSAETVLEERTEAMKLEDEPDSVFFFVEGLDLNKKLFVFKFNRATNDTSIKWVDTSPNNNYRELIFTKNLIYVNTGTPKENSTHGSDCLLLLKHNFFTLISFTPLPNYAGNFKNTYLKKNFNDDYSLIYSQNISYSMLECDSILFFCLFNDGSINSDQLYDVFFGFEDYNLFAINFGKKLLFGDHKFITLSLINLWAKTVIPVPDKMKLLVICTNQTIFLNFIDNQNLFHKFLNINLMNITSNYVYIYSKKEILFVGDSNNFFFFNWDTLMLRFKPCSPNGKIITILPGESEFIVVTQGNVLSFYTISGDFKYNYSLSYPSDIINLKAPDYIGSSFNQFAVLFSNNVIRIYATATKNFIKQFKFSNKVVDFDFIPNKPQMVVITENGKKIDINIYEFLNKIAPVKIYHDYPFKIKALFKSRSKLMAIGQNMVYFKLRFDVKCREGHIADEAKGICIPSCPADRPYRVLSKDTCVAQCPSGTTNTNVSPDIKAFFGDDICLDYREKNAEACEQMIQNCEICFGGECLKCKINFYKKSTNSKYDSCVSICEISASSQSNGYGTCEYFSSGLKNCILRDSTTGECIKCLANMYPTRGYNSANHNQCSDCLLTLGINSYNKKFPSVTPTGEGNEKCTLSIHEETFSCYHYFADCFSPKANSYLLKDLDGNGFPETTTDCSLPSDMKSFWSCPTISLIIENCESYSGSTLCSKCYADQKLVSLKNDSKYDYCDKCSETCSCGPVCSACV